MPYTPRWHTRQDAILTIAQRVREVYPDAWNELKVPGQKSRKYINLVSAACIRQGIPAGVNLKRGGPEQSIDVIALPNDTGCSDSTGTYAGLEIVDIVAGAEGPSPSLTWNDVTEVTMAHGVGGGWVAGDPNAPSHPQPTPPVEPVQPYPDERTWWPQVFDTAVAAEYAKVGRSYPDGRDAFRWASRTAYDIRAGMTKEASLAKHLAELKAELGVQ